MLSAASESQTINTNQQGRGVVYCLITIIQNCSKVTPTYSCSNPWAAQYLPPTFLLWSSQRMPTSTFWPYLLRCSQHPQPPTTTTPVLLESAYLRPTNAHSGPARECLPVPAKVSENVVPLSY